MFGTRVNETDEEVSGRIYIVNRARIMQIILGVRVYGGRTKMPQISIEGCQTPFEMEPGGVIDAQYKIELMGQELPAHEIDSAPEYKVIIWSAYDSTECTLHDPLDSRGLAKLINEARGK